MNCALGVIWSKELIDSLNKEAKLQKINPKTLLSEHSLAFLEAILGASLSEVTRLTDLFESEKCVFLPSAVFELFNSN